MRIYVVIALFLTSFVYAQKGTNSPYSYYGLGVKRFDGNTENALMGGVDAYVDSTRVDVRNPASLGKLARTTFALATSYDFRSMKTSTSSYSERTFLLDYLNLSFPIYKHLGASIGLQPYTSVGYRVITNEVVAGQSHYYALEGSGGVNRAYLAVGYQPIKGLRLGVSGHFNFGKATLENLYSSPVLLYVTREESQSLYRGGSLSLGAQYEYPLSKEFTLFAGVQYIPKASLRSINTRTLTSLQPTGGNFVIKDSRTMDLGDMARTFLTLPSELSLSAGVGKESQWFIGASTSFVARSQYANPFVTSSFVSYKDGYRIGVGGYSLPYNSAYTKYWKRVTYRAGFYYENTGISLRGKVVNDFGITFGASLPIQGFSNITVGGVWGSKGEKSFLKENYFMLKVALTLNDKWFQKSRYN